MPSNYTGNPAATEAPAAAPTARVVPIMSLPVDGDSENVASIYQPFKVAADYIAWLMQNSALAIGHCGDGSDGALSTGGNVTLSKDTYYTNLTVNAGHKITTAGYRIFVNGTLTIAATGAISADGGAGLPGAIGAVGGGGAAAASGSVYGGTGGGTGGASAGGDGVAGTTSNVNLQIIGPGNSGLGGTGGASVGAAGAAGVRGGVFGSLQGGYHDLAIVRAAATFGVVGSDVKWVGISGGTGGGGGGGNVPQGGGGGGAGAGVVVIIANTLVNGGSISANGGAGGASAGGGGGGGGAGVILLAYGTKSGAGTITATAGAGGAGTAAGSAGNSGTIVQLAI